MTAIDVRVRPARWRSMTRDPDDRPTRPDVWPAPPPHQRLLADHQVG
ncbi:hypothetical protein ACIRST_41345 [Kitasatospora sp. NPDC101447]